PERTRRPAATVRTVMRDSAAPAQEAPSVPVTTLFLAWQAQDRQSPHADEQQAEHQSDREQAALVSNHVADDIGTGDTGGDDGGGNNCAERERHARNEFGN